MKTFERGSRPDTTVVGQQEEGYKAPNRKNDDETTSAGTEGRVEDDVLDESVKRKPDVKVPLPINEGKRVEPEVIE